MRITEQAKQMKERSTEVSEFLKKLDEELSEIMDVLSEADQDNALERCKAVHDRLDVFYQKL